MDYPNFDDVLAARDRISAFIHQTPVLTSAYLNRLCDAEIFFKCENLQKTGAFKARGAVNAVFSLDADSAARGVITHSSGNHAGALAYAAARRGIGATLVMPTNTAAVKQAAVRDYGGEIVACEPTLASREATLEQWVTKSGAEAVHPYNDPRVIAGQATCALELLEQVPELDAMVAPIGGGGLISGTCLTFAERSAKTRIYAAEPSNADDAAQSLRAGKIVELAAPQTVADGLRSCLGTRTWHFVSQFVDDVLLADEDEIVDAMYLTWERMKIIIEPSSAVPLAVILKHRELFRGQRVGVIISGGNVDIKNCPGCPRA